MKKLLSALLAALTFAPMAQAAVLGVRDNTGKAMRVVVVGSDNNFNSRNAQTVNNGAEGIFGGTPNVSGPMRFAFVDDLSKNTYNVFETYMGNMSDSEYANPLEKKADGSLKFSSYTGMSLDNARNFFMRNKATGWCNDPGWSGNPQTFPVSGSYCNYIKVFLSDSEFYIDTEGKKQRLPYVQMTWPLATWWQPRPVQPMRVKSVKAVVEGAGESAAW